MSHDGKRPRKDAVKVAPKKRKLLPQPQKHHQMQQKPQQQPRSKGFVTRDQRLPESPPLAASSAAAGSGTSLMAVVRERYRNAVDLLFGTPPRVLNASCTAALNSFVSASSQIHEEARVETISERIHPTRKRGREQLDIVSIQRERGLNEDGTTSSADSDQVVPQAHIGLNKNSADSGCQAGKNCTCADSLWTAGGVGPELMLRTAEELSERILVLYGKAVDGETGNIDYSSLVHSDDFHQYLLVTRKLRYFDPLLLTELERKAFFLNIYNSLMIHAIAVMSKPRTRFERISLYNTASYDIGGRPYSLNMIEHGVLRGNRPGSGPFAQAPFSEADARRLCRLPKVDPRIHFALNCGARSCPAVRFYEAKNLDSTLDAATRAYLQDVQVDSDKRCVTLPKLLQWYKKDFSMDGDVDTVLQWTLPYLEKEKSTVIEKLLQEKETGLGFKVVYDGYDWTVNDSSL